MANQSSLFPIMIQLQLQLLNRGNLVNRFHTTPTIKQETVGHHSATVAGILLILWPTLVDVDLLKYAIFHDSAEFITGDVPSPAKKSMDRTALDLLEAGVYRNHEFVLPDLSPIQRKIFKFADNLAGVSACASELRMGNFAVIEALQNFTSYLDRSIKEFSYDPQHSTWVDEIVPRVRFAHKCLLCELPPHILEEVARHGGVLS